MLICYQVEKLTSSLSPIQRYALHFHETVLKPAFAALPQCAPSQSQKTSSEDQAEVEDEGEEREKRKRKWEEERMVQVWREEMFGDGFDGEEHLLTYDLDLNRNFVDNQGRGCCECSENAFHCPSVGHVFCKSTGNCFTKQQEISSLCPILYNLAQLFRCQALSI